MNLGRQDELVAESGAVEASRINRELLEKTLRADGWTFNAVDFIVEAVREKEAKS